jgi:hypothetical protein
VTVEKARAAAFVHVTKKDEDEFNTDGTLRVERGRRRPQDKFVRSASAWLFERTGTRKMLEAAKAKQPEMFKDVSFDGGEYRGNPVDLARECLERAGVKTRGMDRMKMIGLAFTHRSSNYQSRATSRS